MPTTNAAPTAQPDQAATPKPRLLLIDGHSLAYRAFFALPVENFSTTTGQPTNAVYGFTSMLINVLRDEQPTHMAVAFDVSRKTFRSERYPEYKANRSQTPNEFRGQVSLIEEVLDALRIPRLALDGFEADDLIATLTSQAEAAGYEILICTGDRDALQLVSDSVTVLYPRRGVSDLTRFTPDAVAEKYGLTPAQYPDFAAVRGDPSDNLPNIVGVGEKTAAKWIREFGSLDDLVDRVDEVKGKAGDALRAHLAQVISNRQLTELVRDVELDHAPDDLQLGAWDRQQVHDLFDNLQFRVLRERLFATLSSVEPEADEGFEVDTTVVGAGELAGWLAEHTAVGVRCGVAVTGTWGRGTGTVTGFAVAAPDGAAAFFDPTQLTEDDDGALGDWLADPERPKVMHDVKGPSLAFAAHGWPLAGLACDTALAAYLVLPGQRSFDLGDLTLRYLRRELRAEADEGGQLSLDGSAEQDEAESLAIRARAVLELADELEADVARRGGSDLLGDVELPLLHLLAGMERVGIAVDGDHLDHLSATLAGGVKDAEQATFAVVGHEFNLGSPKQLQQVLFEELSLPKTKRIKSGYTTDADALQSLLAQTGHPVLEHLLRHRDVSKLRSIVDSLIPMIDDASRIHTTFDQIVAATGRLSSRDPNLQNIPIRSVEGRAIRRGFVVAKGFETLLTADYSQIEMRIMAHLSDDAGLIEAFQSGEDLHTYVAAQAFDIDTTAVDPEMRRRIKAMSYGLAYGLSAYGLAQQLAITPDEASAQMERYFERFGGVRDYLKEVVDQARRDGYTETLMGRRRYLPDLVSDNRQRRQMAERMALNAPIQGSAADIIKVAMLRVARALTEAGLTSRMLLQVHDELVFEVAPGELDTVRELAVREMSAAYELRVPLEVSVGVGHDWDAAGH
ncbi:MAG: DNA polymerase I [Streptosporangiales bacterium]|nr:DNA polymerase I [Streptosporangiales bacterium]